VAASTPEHHKTTIGGYVRHRLMLFKSCSLREDMRMRVQRTIPPTAAPVQLRDILHGLAGLFFSERYFQKLEFEIKEYFGVKYVFFVSSGKCALTLILKALRDISHRKDVIIPSYTCFSVPSAILKAGLDILLCDIENTTFDFDYDCLNKT